MHPSSPPFSQSAGMRSRPVRLRILDELGRVQTLPSFADAHSCLEPLPGTATEQCLILGLGPCLDELLPHVGTLPVFFVEDPDFSAQMPTSWHDSIPAHWTRLEPQECILYVRSSRILFYNSNLRLFSQFWGAFWAKIQYERQKKTLPSLARATAAPCVFLAGTDGALLHRELAQSFRTLGFHVHEIPQPLSAQLLLETIETHKPQLFLSINLRGLDPRGESFFILQQCGIPLALWFVDNPWHILSALRSPWWKEAHLFCTDASFIAELKGHGAARVTHLPLACWPEAPHKARTQDMPLIPLLFVGSSHFPDHDRYFSACTHDAQRMQNAHNVAQPDIHWWVSSLQLPQCWPDKAYRQAGFGADACSSLHKLQWLRTATPLGLQLYGDAGWRTLLPECPVRPPVSYYDSLPELYHTARFTLNISSFLLPEGLSQRPFDVWCAHGFLLTEANPGLSIFPQELVQPITLTAPQELAERIAFFQNRPVYSRELGYAWRALLHTQHSYICRIQTILKFMVR